MKKIATKLITRTDPKYRTLYLNNPKLQRKVLVFEGGVEFLYHLGFVRGIVPDPASRMKIVCPEVNQEVVQA